MNLFAVVAHITKTWGQEGPRQSAVQHFHVQLPPIPCWIFSKFVLHLLHLASCFHSVRMETFAQVFGASRGNFKNIQSRRGYHWRWTSYEDFSLRSPRMTLLPRVSPSAVERRLAEAARATSRLCRMLRPGTHRSSDVHWPSLPPSLRPFAGRKRGYFNARRPARREQTLPNSWWGVASRLAGWLRSFLRCR